VRNPKEETWEQRKNNNKLRKPTIKYIILVQSIQQVISRVSMMKPFCDKLAI